MALSNSEKNAIKAKANQYLEKSIYTLSVLLGLDPEVAITATSVSDLTNGVPDMTEIKQQAFDSLYSQIEVFRSNS